MLQVAIVPHPRGKAHQVVVGDPQHLEVGHHKDPVYGRRGGGGCTT